MPIRTLRISAWLAVLLCLWPEDANAYFDPGTGSMILQAVLAALIGISLAFSQVRVKIRSFFQRLVRKILGKSIEHD
ncbi:MAG: hypothetical protein ACE10H_13515 [Candidatus Binatia bacterium]